MPLEVDWKSSKTLVSCGSQGLYYSDLSASMFYLNQLGDGPFGNKLGPTGGDPSCEILGAYAPCPYIGGKKTARYPDSLKRTLEAVEHAGLYDYLCAANLLELVASKKLELDEQDIIGEAAHRNRPSASAS